jgi:hypothetical protein
MVESESGDSVRSRDVGRSVTLALAWLLVVGLLVTVVGACVSAAGAPQIGVVDDWGRVDEAAGRIASWEYLLVILVAVGLVRSRRAGGAAGMLVVAIGESAVLLIAALAGIAGVLERKVETPLTTEYYTGAERIGEIATYVGVGIAAAGVLVFAATSLRVARRASSSDQVEDPGPAAVAG